MAPAAHPTQLADDDPEIWGWHHTFGKSMRITGWVVAIVMLVMMIGNHTGKVEDIWLAVVAACMIGGLVYDASKRRKAWRS